MQFDWGGFFVGISALMTAMVGVLTYRNRGTVNRMEGTIADDLERCTREKYLLNRRNTHLQGRISALETQAVTLRKLLPGGEWYMKLGLGDEDIKG